MALAPDPAGESAHSPLLPGDQHRYHSAPLPCGDGGELHTAIEEGELKERLAAGGVIAACLVLVERRSLGGISDFLLFFRCSWDERVLGLSLYRRRGLKGWSDFRKLLDFLRERGFAGPVIVIERADPLLAEWGIEAPPA